MIYRVIPNSKVLTIGRAITGLGDAGLSVGRTSIISFTVPSAKRPLIIGIIRITYTVAAVLRSLIGGAFTDSITWR